MKSQIHENQKNKLANLSKNLILAITPAPARIPSRGSLVARNCPAPARIPSRGSTI